MTTPVALVLAGPSWTVLAGESERWLTPMERQRANRFQFADDRESFLAAHALVRTCAAELLDVAPDALTLVQRCATCGGPHGKPRLLGHPDLTVTLSHTRGYVAAAASYRLVGVDVDVVSERPLDWSLVRSVLSPAEADEVAAGPDSVCKFVRRWVRKECLIKVGAADLEQMAQADEAGWSFSEWTDTANRVVASVVTPAGTEVDLRTT